MKRYRFWWPIIWAWRRNLRESERALRDAGVALFAAVYSVTYAAWCIACLAINPFLAPLGSAWRHYKDLQDAAYLISQYKRRGCDIHPGEKATLRARAKVWPDARLYQILERAVQHSRIRAEQKRQALIRRLEGATTEECSAVESEDETGDEE